MSSGGRKYTFVYSVQHTGTWFLIRMLRSACPRNKSKQCGDQWFRRHTDRDINVDNLYLADAPLDHSFFLKYGERYIDKNISNIELLIMHGRHNRPGGNFMESLTKYKPSIPILIPMRDPLLAINSKLWREYKSWEEVLKWEKPEDRIARAKQFATCIEQMLSIPRDHAFVLPVDLKYTKDQRMLIGEKVCETCGIEFNEGIQEYVKNWGAENPTANRDGMSKEFKIVKQAYAEKDKETLSRYLDIEMNYLSSRSSLKQKLREIGYKERTW